MNLKRNGSEPRAQPLNRHASLSLPRRHEGSRSSHSLPRRREGSRSSNSLPRRHQGHEDTQPTRLKNNSSQATAQDFRVEIHQQSNPGSAYLQIADDLRDVHGQQPLDGLYLQHDLSVDYQIQSMMPNQGAAIN